MVNDFDEEDSFSELGGFAESPDVIDGDEDDFNAFNYCLACEYYNAVLGEDFESLGSALNDERTWEDTMSTVISWLNYDGEIGKDIEDNLDKIYDGSIITYKNRTFIEAAREHGWTKLADELEQNYKRFIKDRKN